MLKKIINLIKSMLRGLRQLVIGKSWLIFYLSLAILLTLILLSNYYRESKLAGDEPITSKPTLVSVYQPGSHQLEAVAKVNHRGVLEISAQQAGVVQHVRAKEGEKIAKGGTLVQLSSTYQGHNIPAVQLELAQKQWLATHANYWNQSEINEINSELNQNTAWVTRWETNPARSGYGGNGDAYTAYSGQQNSQLQTLQEEISKRQQQLGLDSAELNLKLASITAGLMRPSSPVKGVVEKITVHQGQIVNPGQVVAIVKAEKDEVKLELMTSENVIRYLNPQQPATFELGTQRYPATFDYLSYAPKQENTYQLTFSVPADIAPQLAHNTRLKIYLPLLNTPGQQLLPLKCIYQSHDKSYLYVVGQNQQGELIAKQKQVELGEIIGDAVIVKAGLEAGEQVILNNLLLDGERISLE